jgi:Ran GTPase-activating protein (RanGAP) involved in mRNA processing and transport
MNLINRTKDIYEKKKDSSASKKELDSPIKDRKISLGIKNKVQLFEKQIEEFEIMRKTHNIFEISKKFGLQKFVRRGLFPNEIKRPSQSDNTTISLESSLDLEKIFSEIQDMCENYEKEIDYLKNKLKEEKEKNEKSHTSPKIDKTDSTNKCNACEKIIKELENKNFVLSQKEDEVVKLKSSIDGLNRKYDDFNLHIGTMVNYLSKEPERVELSNNLNVITETLNFDREDKDFMFMDFSTNLTTLNSSSNSPSSGSLPPLILIEIVSENIFKDYKLSFSLNINTLNKKILNHGSKTFLSYLTTCFISNSNTNLTLSIFHEYLQDIIIEIYIAYRRYKSEKIENSQQEDLHSWIISEEDINDEVIKIVVENIFTKYSNFLSNNLISKTDCKNIPHNQFNLQTCPSTPKISPSRDTDKIFFSIFNNESGLSFDYFKYFSHLKNEIKSSFNKKIQNYYLKIKEGITLIVKSCKTFIHAGKLFYKTNMIYDFYKLYSDIISFEQCNNFYNSYETEFLDNPTTNENSQVDSDSNINFNNLQLNSNSSPINNLNIGSLVDNRLYYYQSLDAPDFSDYLINRIKFNSSKTDTISIHGTVAGENRVEGEYNLPLSVILSSISTTSDLSQRIKSLTVSDTYLSEESLGKLNKIIEFCPNLNSLDISNNKIGDKGMRVVSESLKINNTITSLYLAYNNISSNGCFYIAEMILKNHKIKNLFLGGNLIRDLGLQSLINIIINNNKSIKLLDLSNNNLRQNDVIIISNLIMKNCENLETLNLSNQKFDLDCVNTIGLALKVNTHLKCLYLNNISLDEESTPYFLQHLIEANMEEVHVDENNLGEVGGVLFANVLKYNKKLKKVSLKKTNLNSISLMCISHALEIQIGKSQIEFLYLDENSFDDNSVNSLINTFKNHQQKMEGRSKLPIVSLSDSNINFYNNNFFICWLVKNFLYFSLLLL